MRTIEEIRARIQEAMDVSDVQALLRHANELDGMGTKQTIAMAHQARGSASLFQGDNLAGLSHYLEALRGYEELGDRAGMAHIINNIGNVYKATGEYPTALEYYHRALALHEENGDRRSVAITTANIGMVYASTGDYPTSLEYYHRGLSIHEEIGNHGGVARVTSNVGNVYLAVGDFSAALEQHHRALTLHEQLGDHISMARDTNNIGVALLGTSTLSAALEHFQRALTLHEENGNRSGVASALSNIVRTCLEMDSVGEAGSYLDRLDAMQIDDPGKRIERDMHHAMLQARQDDVSGAIVTLRRVLAEADAYGLRPRAAYVHFQLRDMALKSNDLAGYVEHNLEYTRITEEINGKDTATKFAMQKKQREIEAERKETEKQLAVLYSALPKHIANRVARGETVNDHYDSAVVIFLDIVGFTTISDRIPSGHVVYLLERIFTTLDAVCRAHSVVKIKTIGDSYMAVAFSNTEDQIPNTGHVLRAGLCAVEMLTAMNELEITMPPELGDTSWTKDISDIQVRIGLHCGPVTAGVIGTERMQYDVWGDTVNVASRMESSGEPGRIHVSEAFATALRSENRDQRTENNPSPHPSIPLSLHQRGTVEIKGKGPMTTYWLESA